MNDHTAGTPTTPPVAPPVIDYASAPVVETPMTTETIPVVEDTFTLTDALDELPANPETLIEVPAAEAPIVPSVESEENLAPAREPNALHQYSTKLSKTTGSPDTISLPPATEEVIKDRLSNVPNLDIMLSGKQLNWGATLQDSLQLLPMNEMYSSWLAQPGSEFVQSVMFNGTELRGRAPTFKNEPGTHEVDGERALLQLVTHIGAGGLFRAPMWNSGIWVMFKPATEDELLELNRILFADKIQFGRWSYGLALSNSVVYTMDRVFDFALRHAYNTSVKSEELPISKLRDHIAPQDINSFIWGFLCANYPSGFHYRHGCINNPTKCNHVEEETLNVTKLQNTDKSVLTDWQKQHMSSMSANTKSLDSIKRYREEMKLLQNRRVIFNQGTENEVAITIKTPSVTEYIDKGHRWIGGIVDGVTAVLGEDATPDERNAMINRHGKATTLCQYVHFVESIEFGQLSESPNDSDRQSVKKITDAATIETSLKALSAMDNLREEITDAIMKYIDDTTISVIGIPAFDCPVCGAPQEPKDPIYPRHVSIIPLDVLQVFFALLSQRLGRIAAR